MIGQIVKETVLVNSAEVEKEKVAGGVKLNFSQAVKDQLAQITKNKNAIEDILGGSPIQPVAAITLDYVSNTPDQYCDDNYLFAEIDAPHPSVGDIISVTYQPTDQLAPEDFPDGDVPVIMSVGGIIEEYNLSCNVEAGQTKLMQVSENSDTQTNDLVDVESVTINDLVARCDTIENNIATNTSAISTINSTLAQVDKNKVAIESIVGDIDVTTVAAVTLNYVPVENEGEANEVAAHLAGIVDVELEDGAIIAATYAPAGNGAPTNFDGAIEVVLTKDSTDTTYNLKCKIEKGQSKLMVVELGQEHNYLDDALLNLAELDAKITALNSTINTNKKTRKNITLAVNDWTLDNGLYKNTVPDNSVTADHLIEVVMDLANQAKLTDGYVESANGSYTFYTSVAPTEAISATVIFELTEAAV